MTDTRKLVGTEAALQLKSWLADEMFDAFLLFNSQGFYNSHSNYGFIDAMGQAMRRYSPVYGCPMYTLGGANATTGLSHPQGYPIAGLNFAQQYQATGAGRWFDAAVRDDAIDTNHPDMYAYYSQGRGIDASSPYSSIHRMYLNKADMTVANDPVGFSVSASGEANDIQPTDPLKGYVVYWDTTTAGGTFRPGFNSYNGTTYTKRAEAASQEIFSGDVGSGTSNPVYLEIDQPAVPGATWMELSWSPRGGTIPTGRVALGYSRFVHATRTKGFAMHNLWTQGGKSPRDMSNAISLMPDTTLRHALVDVGTIHQRFLTKPARNVIFANDIFNQLNEDQTSINYGLEAASADAMIDDWRYILRRLFSVWDQTYIASYGFLDPRNLLVVFCNDFPQAEPESAANLAYREAMATLAEEFAPRVISLNTHNFFDNAAILAAGGYDSSGNAHLTRGAYQEWTRRIIQQIIGTRSTVGRAPRTPR